MADAVRIYLATITVKSTRRGCAGVLNRMVRDLGADANVALLTEERVGVWFTFVWGEKAASTFNVRLAALRTACAYWREQKWLTDDPLVRLRAKPTSRMLPQGITQWHMQSRRNIGRGSHGSDPAHASRASTAPSSGAATRPSR